MAKRRIRTRFWLFLTAVVLIIALIVIVSTIKTNNGLVQWGEIHIKKTFDGVIIRDEQVKTSEKYDKIVFAVTEGQSVTANTKIADVFKLGYNDEILKSLLSIQKEIINYQLSLIKDVVNANLEKVNYDINAVSKNIRSVILGNKNDDLLKLEQQLDALLSQRAAILKEISKTDAKLTDLYTQETEANAKLSQWKIEVTSPGAGIVSFYFDGYEEALNASKIQSVTPDLIKTVLSGTKINAQNLAQSASPIFRLINNMKWYLAFTTDAGTAEGLISSGEYTVSFEGYYNSSYKGKMISKTLTEKGVTVVLEFNENIGTMIDVRKGKATLKQDVSGLKVPVGAIHVAKDGTKGIYLVEGGQRTYVEINVLVADSENAIIEPKDPTKQILPEQRYAIQ